MKSESDLLRVAVIGAGAVGCYFGGMLARAGVQVTLLGRPGSRNPGLEAMARDGLRFESVNFHERVAVAVSADPAAVHDADIVLFTVKTIDTESAARGMASYLRPGAVVLSLQNGVENEEEIRAALSPAATVVPAVVYVAAAMAGPGHLKHSARGDLVIGAGHQPPPEGTLERVAKMFQAAGVPCKISENIEGDLWFKLVWNCAGNAVSALGRATYGLCGGAQPSRELMTAAALEVIAVAEAAGIKLPKLDPVAMGEKVVASFGDATSSTSQDVERGRRTEIDSLNGVVVRRGAALGVATPINRTLWALVKLLDASNAARQKAQS